MGKGDLRTFRGKKFNHSYGVKRPRRPNTRKLMIPIEKFPHEQKGVIGESFINELAFKAYLKYWCYPNPLDINGDKKEICDLLILFFDTIIIISVKNYDTKGNYKRFKKKVIDKSSNQLFGAERKLFNSKHEVRIQHPEKGIETFNPKKYQNIFRITVSLGRDINEYEFIDSHIGKGLVNVFNKDTFLALTNELDTIKDLSEYLRLRERVLRTNTGKFAKCSEKDILAYYLLNNREFPPEFENNFESETNKLSNKWVKYINNKSVFLKKLADENSYFIDKLIENDVLKIPNGEALAAELMTLSRFERRLIANNLFEIVNKFQDKDDFVARRFTKYNDVGFLFIYYPIERTQQEIDILIQHASQLYAYFHHSKKIVVLGAAKRLVQWKFGLFLASTINKEQEESIRALAKAYGWFQNEIRIQKDVKEYPDE